MSDLAKLIDHTALKPDVTRHDIETLCEEAKANNFASVCINPYWVKVAAEALVGSGVKVCTVIGFPLGATTTDTKAYETTQALEHGAEEVDMVINIGALKDGQQGIVQDDIQAVVVAAQGRALVKVILETCLLSDEEIIRASEWAQAAGADFVKTSTGFSSGGATEKAVSLMRETVGEVMGVKASGGIRDRETAEKMVAAGATRLGASAGVSIINQKG